MNWRLTATDGNDSTAATNGDGVFFLDVAAMDAPPALARSFALTSYPNPFNPATEIRFTLPQSARVALRVYDIAGRQVAVLADGLHAAGEHRAHFDGADLPSGLYFARLDAGSYRATQKLMLLK